MKSIMIQKTLKDESGLGLIETIAALGVGIIVLTALISLSVFTLRTSTKGKLLLEGSKLANQQVELARAYRDSTDWATFTSAMNGCTSSSLCNFAISSGTVGVTSGAAVQNANTPTEISVSFYASDPIAGDENIASTDDIVRVNITVSWKVGSQDETSYIYTDLSNWRSQ